MSSSFEKSVKGATKIKNAPPKTKYIEHILVATHSGEAGIAEVIRALQYRLRDSTWTVVFKSLITVHLMIREGSPNVTLAYLSQNRNALAISNFTDAVTQGRNIRHYANYLSERSRAYRETKTDWVGAPESRLEQLGVEKGLLRQTEIVQRQLAALLKCDVLDNEPENEITITVFRLLVLDLLALFQVLNQGLINILGHFFEMSKTDAEKAMEIYRTFTKQTDFVVAFLSVARQHEHHTQVQVPKLKHAPVHLGRQLEDYLKDPDFEIHRRQYIAEQEAKGKKVTTSSPRSPKSPRPGNRLPSPASNNPFPIKKSPSPKPAESKQPAAPQANKGPDPDLIDFFGSIEQNQTAMPIQTPPQPTTNPFPPQMTGFQQPGPMPNLNASPYQQQQVAPQLQPNMTGAGFGGFGPQQQAFQPQQGFQPSSLGTIPQNTVANFPQNQPGLQPQPMAQPAALQPIPTGQQSTNPFRQSMLPQQTGIQSNMSPTLSSPGSGAGTPALQRQSTNPFARSSPQPQFQPQQQAAPLVAAPTGTNPFARNAVPAPQPQEQQRPVTAGGALSGGLMPQPTGVTNPFRQSQFVNHATGLGWQHNQQPIGGGIDQLATQQVFPRPLQQTPWQQQ
ncbi:unnamed protein product [Clonostachys rosea f. rosea IK726]|uniref:ENTH domain-containing protein n=2 Tax=Bionectria ochroleuca TaxID=29856 RepID=A0A0B7JN02_BIOOC|nr:unnamed protein product [Clonostachys rosea f. rosea IK726]